MSANGTEPPYRCAKRGSVVRYLADMGRGMPDEQLGDTQSIALFDRRSPKANIGTVSCRKTLGNRSLRWFNTFGSEAGFSTLPIRLSIGSQRSRISERRRPPCSAYDRSVASFSARSP
jgi:hypothetical protein